MKSKFGLAILVVLGVGGCSPNPELVFIDRSRFIPVNLDPATQGPLVDRETVKGDSFTIPSLAQRTLYVDEVRERFDRAMAEVEVNQQELMRQMFEALRKVYLADLATMEGDDRRKAEAEYEANVGAVYGQVRAIFLKYADTVGMKWYRLAFLVGFPDPDPRSRRVARSDDKEQQAVYEEAKKLRAEISDLGATFHNEVESLLLGASQELSINLKELRDQYDIQRLAREAEAEAEAREIALRAVSRLQDFVLDPTQSLPSQPGANITIPTVQNPIRRLSSAPVETAFGYRERLDEQIKIFLDTKRYRPATSNKGVRDVTEEFAAWRKKYEPGQ